MNARKVNADLNAARNFAIDSVAELQATLANLTNALFQIERAKVRNADDARELHDAIDALRADLFTIQTVAQTADESIEITLRRAIGEICEIPEE